MSVTIKSDKLTAVISSMGAELRSVKDNSGNEFMWEGNPAYWEGVSPVLFPICSGLKGNKYKYMGKEYTLGKHGFAQHSKFEIESHSDSRAVLLLKSTPETKEVYPFDFEFRVVFELAGNVLKTDYCIKNLGGSTMYFEVGAHEGYATPEGIEEYDIVFDTPQTLDTYILDGDVLSYNSANVITDSKVLPLKEDWFRVDALIFPGIKARAATLVHRNGTRKIRVDFSSFENMLVWHVCGGKYICIEPWNGITDRPDCTGNIEDKYSMRHLAPGAEYEAHHSIEFNL
ncbi:MAG: aldose 1-epimerase family protein [Clostridia bacterium]|nr:aldose 1-epimerase family protein [Clostridia bacterium]